MIKKSKKSQNTNLVPMNSFRQGIKLRQLDKVQHFGISATQQLTPAVVLVILSKLKINNMYT